MIDTLTFSGSFDPLADAIAECKRRWPERVHLRFVENVSLCMHAGDHGIGDVWGEYLTDIPAEVGCTSCLEWMHA